MPVALLYGLAACLASYECQLPFTAEKRYDPILDRTFLISWLTVKMNIGCHAADNIESFKYWAI